jgi:hypothetical protein
MAIPSSVQVAFLQEGTEIAPVVELLSSSKWKV